MREVVTGSIVHIDPSCRCTVPLYSTEKGINKFKKVLVKFSSVLSTHFQK